MAKCDLEQQVRQLSQLVSSLVERHVEFVGTVTPHLPPAAADEAAEHARHLAVDTLARLTEITV